MNESDCNNTRDILAHVSHEIRNALNGIIGFTELLRETSLSDDQAHYTESLRTSSEHLMSIVNSILDMSKIEAGRIELEEIEFDIRYSLELIYDTTAEEARRKNISFNIVCDPSIPPLLKGDPTRLRQVLSNLISNALKFTERGDIMLSVIVEEEREKEVLLRFSVKDTGIGIDESHQDTVFDSYTQTDASVTRKYGGTGLGLSISKKLVRMMGGRLRLTSAAGRGSTFYFTIPVTKRESGHIVGRWDLPDIADIQLAVLSGNRHNLTKLSSYLDFLSSPPFTFTSAAECIRFLEQPETGHNINCILIDTNVSAPDYTDTVEKIRNSGFHASTPLILISSSGTKEEIQQYRDLNISGYLTRPVNRAELHNAIALSITKQKQDGDDIDIPFITKHLVRELNNRLSILVVEDDPVNRELLSSLLTRQGHNTVIAENGSDAVARALCDHFSLILMDIHIPLLDGFSAASIIRSHEANSSMPRVPIIAVTADAESGFAEKCRKAGIDGYLAKPVEPEELNRKIAGMFVNSEEESLCGVRTAAIEDAVFDSAGLLRRCSGSRELARETVRLFTELCTAHVKTMKEALSSSGTASIADTAHSIKGAALNTGAAEIAAAAGAIEMHVSSETPSSLPSLLTQFEDMFQRFRQTVKKEWEMQD